MTAPKLTVAQCNALQRAMTEISFIPFRGEWRTARKLETLGLIKRRNVPYPACASGTYEITEAGRAALSVALVSLLQRFVCRRVWHSPICVDSALPADAYEQLQTAGLIRSDQGWLVTDAGRAALTVAT